MEALIHLFVGGFGGTLPTIAKWGAILTSDHPDFDTPSFGFYVGVSIYFAVGSVISFALRTANDKRSDALFRGIAAPALLASFLVGAEHSRRLDHSMNSSFFPLISSPARADEPKRSTLINDSGRMRSLESRALSIMVFSQPFLTPKGRAMISVYLLNKHDLSREKLLTSFSYDPDMRYMPVVARDAKVPDSPVFLEVVCEDGGKKWRHVLREEKKGGFAEMFPRLIIDLSLTSTFFDDVWWGLGGPHYGRVTSMLVSFEYEP